MFKRRPFIENNILNIEEYISTNNNVIGIMLLTNNKTDKIIIIDRKLSKSIMLFNIKSNIIKNKTNK